MDNLESMYTDIIMEQSTATYNKHELNDKTDSEHGHNPSCGDDITLEIKMDGDKTVGAIAPKMNKALGEQFRRSRRGN